MNGELRRCTRVEHISRVEYTSYKFFFSGYMEYRHRRVQDASVCEMRVTGRVKAELVQVAEAVCVVAEGVGESETDMRAFGPAVLWYGCSPGSPVPVCRVEYYKVLPPAERLLLCSSSATITQHVSPPV